MYFNILKKGFLSEILQFTMKCKIPLPDVKSQHFIPLFMISDNMSLSSIILFGFVLYIQILMRRICRALPGILSLLLIIASKRLESMQFTKKSRTKITRVKIIYSRTLLCVIKHVNICIFRDERGWYTAEANNYV